MDPDENQKEIHKLTHEILEKKNKLEELLGKKLKYRSNGEIDHRSLRMDTSNQEKFKEYNKLKREKLKKARMEELEASLDRQLQKTINSVIERKKAVSVEKEKETVISRESTPLKVRPNSF